jgi:hypothetical protein
VVLKGQRKIFLLAALSHACINRRGVPDKNRPVSYLSIMIGKEIANFTGVDFLTGLCIYTRALTGIIMVNDRLRKKLARTAYGIIEDSAPDSACWNRWKL